MQLREQMKALDSKIADDRRRLQDKREVERLQRQSRAKVEQGELELRLQEQKMAITSRFEQQEADMKRKGLIIKNRIKDTARKEEHSIKDLAQRLNVVKADEEKNKTEMEGAINEAKASSAREAKLLAAEKKSATQRAAEQQGKLLAQSASEKQAEADANKLKLKQKSMEETAAAATAQLVADSSKQKAADAENMLLETKVTEAQSEEAKLAAKKRALASKLELRKQQYSQDQQMMVAQNQVEDSMKGLSEQLAQARAKESGLRKGLADAEAAELSQVQALKHDALRAEMEDREQANALALTRSKDAQRLAAVKRAEKNARAVAALNAKRAEEHNKREQEEAEKEVAEEMANQKRKAQRAEEELQAGAKIKLRNLEESAASRKRALDKKALDLKLQLKDEKERTAAEAKKAKDNAKVTEREALSEEKAMKSRIATEEAEAEAEKEKDIADLKARAAKRMEAEQEQARLAIEQSSQVQAAAEAEAKSQQAQLNSQANGAMTNAKALADQKIASLKARAKLHLEEVVKMATADKDRQIQEAERKADQAEEETQQALAEEASFGAQEDGLKGALRKTKAELKSQLEQNQARVEHVIAQKGRLQTKIDKVKNNIIHQTNLKSDAEATEKKLRAFRFVYKNKLRRTKANVEATEKQLAETSKMSARRDEELELAAHKLEQARDKELQLKSQFEVLEEARKNASAKAAEDQANKASNDLKRVKTKAELKESRIEQEEAIEASRLQRLQEEAIATKQEVDELTVERKASRQLLSKHAVTLDAKQLMTVESDAIQCATACKDGSPYTAGKGLAACMKKCLEKALNPKVIAKAKAKAAVDWQQSELDDLVMMGAMKKVRKELSISQARAKLSKILKRNPRKSGSHRKYKAHKLKAAVEEEYDTFQTYVGKLTPVKQQHILAEAELARTDLSKLANKYAPHKDATNIRQSSGDDHDQARISDDNQKSGSSQSKSKQEPNDQQQQVKQVEQQFEAQQQQKETKQEKKVQQSEKQRVNAEQEQEQEELKVEKRMAAEEKAARAKRRRRERFLPKSIRMKLHKKRVLARCSDRCSSFAPCMWKCMRADEKREEQRNK
jgi:hypothetical protein